MKKTILLFKFLNDNKFEHPELIDDHHSKVLISIQVTNSHAHKNITHPFTQKSKILNFAL